MSLFNMDISLTFEMTFETGRERHAKILVPYLAAARHQDVNVSLCAVP
jgi:hypothetical protein